MHITKWKKPKAIYYRSPSYMTSWKSQDYVDSRKTDGCQGLGAKEEMVRQSTEEFQDSETIL